MAEPDTDPTNIMSDEDLEDGEIETEEENDVIIEEVKPAAKVVAVAVAVAASIEQTTKPKSFEDELKKVIEVKGENRKSTPDNNTKTMKSAAASDVAKGESSFSFHNSISIKF